MVAFLVAAVVVVVAAAVDAAGVEASAVACVPPLSEEAQAAPSSAEGAVPWADTSSVAAGLLAAVAAVAVVAAAFHWHP